MKIIWLNKENNKSCILFFNGWAMDENAVLHLEITNYDICMLNDYNPLSSIDNITESYDKVYLIAWSLGVWAASSIIADSIKLEKSIAINGTINPIDDKKGIPTAIFNHTLNTWNEVNAKKFNMRMLGGRSQYELLVDKLSNRSIENQHAELAYLESRIKSQESREEKKLSFDTVLIGNGDLIFSAENQRNYWRNKSKMVEKDVPHYPFAIFNSWQEIIDL